MLWLGAGAVLGPFEAVGERGGDVAAEAIEDVRLVRQIHGYLCAVPVVRLKAMGRCRCCWCWGASSSPHRRAATGPDGEEILPPLGAAAAGHGGACRPRALPWLFLLPSLYHPYA